MKRVVILIIAFMAVAALISIRVEAAEPDDYDFSQIDEVMGNTDFDFKETVKLFFSGETDKSLTGLGQALLDSLFSELAAQKSLITRIVILGVAAAVFMNVASAFLKGSIAQTGFYITFMLLMGTLMSGYVIAADLVTDAMNSLLEFMEAVVPIYTLSVGFAAGSSSAQVRFPLFTPS